MKFKLQLFAAALAAGLVSSASAEEVGYQFAHGDAAVNRLVGTTNMPPENAVYRDPSRPVEERVEDVLRYMELREKFAVCTTTAGLSLGGLPRIGLADFRCPDGPNGIRTDIKEKKPVTYFPAPIAYAACWDKALAYEIGRALGEEVRGCYRSDEVPARMLLGPTVNINRSPLGGRAFENFGEDPVLAGKTAAQYCRGLQSVHVSPCIKHYLLNDQEWCRVVLDVDAPERAIREIYARPFEIAAKEADAWSLMNSYNAVRGKFASQSRYLMDLLHSFGYTGSVFADWGGWRDDIGALNAGTTMASGEGDRDWKRIDRAVQAYNEGKIDRVKFEDNVRRNLRHAFRVGAFDTWTKADRAEQRRCEESMLSKEHLETARRVARESFVLLKNEGGFLPVDRSKIGKIALIGPGADQHYSMIDGKGEPQCGGAAAIMPAREPTPLEEFVNEFGRENVIFAPGFRYHLRNPATVPGIVERDPVAAAKEADLVVFCGGTDHDYDQEASGWYYVQNSDKPDIDLKGPQARLIERVAKANPNVVVALNIGSPVLVEPWDARVKGIVVTWYSGEVGAKALVDMILGRFCPSGRLPYTFGRDLEDWPCHRMGELCYPGIMTNHVRKYAKDLVLAKEYYSDGIWVGYRGFDHFRTKPKYPFGFGLSYTKFTLRDGDEPFSVKVTNAGGREGRCVVQCYVSKRGRPGAEMPPKELVDFESVELAPGETKTVVFRPADDWFRYWGEKENRWLDAREGARVLIGTSSADLPIAFPVELWSIMRRFRSSVDGTSQPYFLWTPEKAKTEAVPLVVGLHTWSYDYRQSDHYLGTLAEAKRRGWAFVGSDYRGANNHPDGCASDKAVQDVVDAVEEAAKLCRIDRSRIYVQGGSGGGHMTLVLLGRRPDIFAAGAAYCPITDLVRWHAESLEKHPGRETCYARMMEKSCGGTPAEKPSEYAARSPLTWLTDAKKAGVKAYICTGIHDGWKGSVPVGHTLRAFNALCAEGDAIGEDAIAEIERTQAIPASLKSEPKDDPFYGQSNRIHFRRTSGNVRVTLFEGGHGGNTAAGYDFLARQRRGAPADWTLPASGKGVVEQLTK